MHSFALLATILAAGLASADSLVSSETHSTIAKRNAPKVTIKGNAFYADGKRFYIRGMDYQPGGESTAGDPLSDKAICDRDVQVFKDLGINTIRVYIVDNTANHDYCMNKLAEAGIYLVLDVNNPKYSINRLDPKISYNAAYLQSVFATIDAFAKYDNTLAFLSGNEVINHETVTTGSAPYVKAATRDMRAYIKARNYRSIPVGYAAADISENRWPLAQYFNCGSDSERSDFFAFNDYSWCSTDFITAGWDKKVETFKDLGIPIFLAEYGCNLNKRDFKEVSALMSPNMTSVYSGGLMYEYTVEASNYGIARVNGNSVNPTDEYQAFKKALKDYPAPSGDGGAASSSHAVNCPARSKEFDIDTSAALPAMPSAAQKYFDKGAGAGPGLKGDGSQSAGEKADGPAPGDGSGKGNGNGNNGGSKNAGNSVSVGRWSLAGIVGVAVAVGFAFQ